MSPFLAWGDFHARWRFARLTIPEEKCGTTRSLVFFHPTPDKRAFVGRDERRTPLRTPVWKATIGINTVKISFRFARRLRKDR